MCSSPASGTSGHASRSHLTAAASGPSTAMKGSARSSGRHQSNTWTGRKSAGSSPASDDPCSFPSAAHHSRPGSTAHTRARTSGDLITASKSTSARSVSAMSSRVRTARIASGREAVVRMAEAAELLIPEL
ncbi:hypothetical protein ID875_31900 [Streptomyces globisporus]|uniref:Uncharacterized protein n=1 Tax=Streptomyces globisporus TaxID=1908 RepID=A0A927BMX9_STRGL|nr:hypothetical protein [Streptomyces globisporus]